MKKLKTTVLKILKKVICKQIENTNKEIENIKRNQTEIPELKSTITEMKNSLEGFQGILEQAEASSNLNIEQWKLLKVRNRKKKDERKIEHSLSDTIKQTIYSMQESQKEKRKKVGREDIWRNNVRKLSKFAERHEYKYLRSSTNSK